MLEQFIRLYPNAPIATLVHSPNLLPASFAKCNIISSRLDALPKAHERYRELLPLHPWAIRGMRLKTDVKYVLSSDAAMIKGIPLPMGVRHVCYCHSPPRYLWGLADQYTKNAGLVGRAKGLVLRSVMGYLKRFDLAGAKRVDLFIANSRFVKERIKQAYSRDSVVVYPPVDISAFEWRRPKKNFHLLVSHLVPYKRVDIAVQAYRDLPVRLVVIGAGPERERLEAMASSNIEFLGSLPFPRLKEYMETASAFLYPQIEDFGITAIEAQAAGCPLIAYRAGGALETVVEGRSGLFFDRQDSGALAAAAMRVIRKEVVFLPQVLRDAAEAFSEARFRREIWAHLERAGFPEPSEV